MAHSFVIVLIAALFAGAAALLEMQGRTRAADQRLGEHVQKGLAQNVAGVGQQVVARKLAASAVLDSWSNLTIPSTAYGGGTYRAEISRHNGSGDTVDVVVRGAYGPAKAAIFARYARGRDEEGTPPAFRNAVAADTRLTIAGSLLVDAVDHARNVSVHSTEWALVDGSHFLAEGYGTYVAEPSAEVKDRLETRFVPNQDVNGDAPNLLEVDAKTVNPEINAGKLFTAAQSSGAWVTGPVTISEDIDFTDPTSPLWARLGAAYDCAMPPCGTEDNPFVLYIDGGVTFDSRTAIRGYGTVYSAQDVYVTGAGLYGEINSSMNTQVLLATMQNIVVGDDTCLGLGPTSYTRDPSQPSVATSTAWDNDRCASADGHYSSGLSLYAGGSVSVSGDTFLVGGVVADQVTFDSTGAAWIAYAAPAEEVVDSGFEYGVPIGPVLIAYSEW